MKFINYIGWHPVRPNFCLLPAISARMREREKMMDFWSREANLHWFMRSFFGMPLSWWSERACARSFLSSSTCPSCPERSQTCVTIGSQAPISIKQAWSLGKGLHTAPVGRRRAGKCDHVEFAVHANKFESSCGSCSHRRGNGIRKRTRSAPPNPLLRRY